VVYVLKLVDVIWPAIVRLIFRMSASKAGRTNSRSRSDGVRIWSQDLTMKVSLKCLLKLIETWL
jgi:hypothetical protein